MAWLAPCLALVGVLIGVGATVVVERLRWRRDGLGIALTMRQEAYTAYLAALHQAGERLWALACGDTSAPAPADVHAREAFRTANVYAHLERVLLTSPPGVQTAAQTAFHAMRDLRDCVAAGNQHGSPEHTTAEQRWEDSRNVLRDAMRTDLANLALRT